MKKVLIFIVLTAMVTACKQKGWSTADKQKWMQECSTGASTEVDKDTKEKICNCVLEKIEKKYANYDEYSAKSTDAENVELMVGCGVQGFNSPK